MEKFDVDLCFDVAMNAVKEAGEVTWHFNRRYEIEGNRLTWLTEQLMSLKLKLIRKAFDEKKQVLQKSCDIDLVTETDQAVEKLLIQRVKENFPTHKY